MFERLACMYDNAIDDDWSVVDHNRNNIRLISIFSPARVGVFAMDASELQIVQIKAQQGRRNILNFAFLSRFIGGV